MVSLKTIAWSKLKIIQDQFARSVYAIEPFRIKYELCPAKTGFFQPFTNLSDVQQQFKTTVVPPIVGLGLVAGYICGLIRNILMMALSIPCISPSLFIEGLVDSIAAIESIVVTPLVACVITLASLVAMVTRTFATIASYDGGELKDEWLSFLPKNPYPSRP